MWYFEAKTELSASLYIGHRNYFIGAILVTSFLFVWREWRKDTIKSKGKTERDKAVSWRDPLGSVSMGVIPFLVWVFCLNRYFSTKVYQIGFDQEYWRKQIIIYTFIYFIIQSTLVNLSVNKNHFFATKSGIHGIFSQNCWITARYSWLISNIYPLY